MDRGSQLDEDNEDDEEDKEDEEEEDEAGGGRRKAEGGSGRQEEEAATDIKSNNPHLAGGEKTIQFLSFLGCFTILTLGETNFDAETAFGVLKPWASITFKELNNPLFSSGCCLYNRYLTNKKLSKCNNVAIS